MCAGDFDARQEDGGPLDCKGNGIHADSSLRNDPECIGEMEQEKHAETNGMIEKLHAGRFERGYEEDGK